eukprot:scaffold153_cov105-Isochrysis_galbana.AAC.4
MVIIKENWESLARARGGIAAAAPSRHHPHGRGQEARGIGAGAVHSLLRQIQADARHLCASARLGSPVWHSQMASALARGKLLRRE